MSLVLLAALAGGVGFAFLISQLRPTFNDERRLQEVSGLPVFGTVVMAWTESQKAKPEKGIGGVLAFLREPAFGLCCDYGRAHAVSVEGLA